MWTLTPGDGSYILISVDGGANIPQPLTRYVPQVSADGESLAIIDTINIGQPLMPATRFDELINGNTSAAFTTADELRDFVAAYLMYKPAIGAVTEFFEFDMKTVPVDSNDKPAGVNTLQDASMNGWTPRYILVTSSLGTTATYRNNTNMVGTTNGFDFLTDTITLESGVGNFMDGDNVLVIATRNS